MNRNEGNELYLKAQKLALRDYREKMLAGQSPFLPVLDDILQNVPVENQIPLGQVDIPLNLLVGTKTTGRTAAFASNFMPLLDLKTEFATKWVNLCLSHLEEGIRDPIRCYEYMGRFYVQEGNKRVSVLKFFDASSILGNVTRVVPQYSDDPSPSPAAMPACKKSWAKARMKSGAATTAPRYYPFTTGSKRLFWPTAAQNCAAQWATYCCCCCVFTPKRSLPSSARMS